MTTPETAIETHPTSPCPTLDQLTELYRENCFEIIDCTASLNCAGEPMLNIIRFEGDEDEGKRAVDIALQNGHGFWLHGLQHTWDLEGGIMTDDPYWRLTFYTNSTNRQG